MTPRQELGLRIGAERTKRKMGVLELAEAAGVGESTVHRVESGRLGLRLKTVVRIARTLDVSLDALLEGIEL